MEQPTGRRGTPPQLFKPIGPIDFHIHILGHSVYHNLASKAIKYVFIQWCMGVRPCPHGHRKNGQDPILRKH